MDALLRHSGNRLPMDIVIPFGGKAISFTTIGYSSFLAGLGSEGYKTHLLAIGQPDHLVGNDIIQRGGLLGVPQVGGWGEGRAAVEATNGRKIAPWVTRINDRRWPRCPLNKPNPPIPSPLHLSAVPPVSPPKPTVC